jgi:hypothetical protein
LKSFLPRIATNCHFNTPKNDQRYLGMDNQSAVGSLPPEADNKKSNIFSSALYSVGTLMTQIKLIYTDVLLRLADFCFLFGSNVIIRFY